MTSPYELVGLALPFGKAIWRERWLCAFAPSCCTRSIRNESIPLLVDHIDSPIYGWSGGGPGKVNLWQTRLGLFFSLQPNSLLQERLVDQARAGEFAGVSVAFGAMPSAVIPWSGMRMFVEVTIQEVSLVSTRKRPAFESTFVRVRPSLPLQPTGSVDSHGLFTPAGRMRHTQTGGKPMEDVRMTRVLARCAICGLLPSDGSCPHSDSEHPPKPLLYRRSNVGTCSMEAQQLTIEISARTGLPKVECW